MILWFFSMVLYRFYHDSPLDFQIDDGLTDITSIYFNSMSSFLLFLWFCIASVLIVSSEYP